MSEIKRVKSGFVEVSGARLFYEMAGEGTSVVFLHGGLLDGRMWDEQIQFFSEHYQAIRYDMRRSGKSEDAASVEPYTYVHYQDLYDLLRALSLQKVSLVGLSGGARIAIDMAIAHPEMVQKLIAVSPGISGCVFVDEWTQQQGKKLGEAMSQQNMAQAIEVFLTMWTDGPYRTATQIPLAMRERVHEMVMHSVSQNIMALDMHELEPPAIGRLSEIQAPILIMLGEKDTSDIHTIGRLLHRNVAGSELVIVPDTGHTLSMEKPSEFNSLVERFLRA